MVEDCRIYGVNITPPVSKGAVEVIRKYNMRRRQVMTTKEPSQEAIEAVAAAIQDKEMWQEEARAAILAYHAHLASKGLKVTDRNLKNFDPLVNTWKEMHDAGPEVFG